MTFRSILAWVDDRDHWRQGKAGGTVFRGGGGRTTEHGLRGVDHWAMLQNAIRLGVNIALGTAQFPFEPNDGTTATVAAAEVYVKAGMTPLKVC